MRMRLFLFGVVALGCACTQLSQPRSSVGAAQPASHEFGAPGRIEGSSEPIEIGAGIDGVLKSVDVNEGDRVISGQILARVSCDDLTAAISSANAESQAAQMRLLILQKGTRREDLDLARARVSAALAAKNKTAQFYERARQLWETDKLISTDELQRAARDSEAAAANLEAVTAEARRAEAGPLPEELAEASALVERARHRVLELRSRREKCDVTSPMTGTVLKKLLLPGETVSTVFPQPIVIIANLDEWRVRAEVDEHDIDRVRENMGVVVTSPSWGNKAYKGTVKAISPSMGRRRVRTGDPAEKSDRDIREVIIGLDGHGFVVGLRVDVRFHENLSIGRPPSDGKQLSAPPETQ